MTLQGTLGILVSSHNINNKLTYRTLAYDNDNDNEMTMK